MVSQYDLAEEMFITKFLDFGDDVETTKANLAKCEDLLLEFRPKLKNLAEEMEDGLAFDESSAILTIQIVAIAQRLKARFMEQLNAA